MKPSRKTMSRLEAFATEPPRLPMGRESMMMPTPGAQLNKTRLELERTREALRDALAIIRSLMAEQKS